MDDDLIQSVNVDTTHVCVDDDLIQPVYVDTTHVCVDDDLIQSVAVSYQVLAFIAFGCM